jgi:orotate phosphoribosyltransferase
LKSEYKYKEAELVRVAAMDNNKKRNYLVVNPMQGKYIPAPPSDVLEMYTALADAIGDSYKGERLLVIGFAETSTAIGAHIAIALGGKYIQTTREDIPGIAWLSFPGPHGNTAAHRIVQEELDAAVAEADRIIMVEDVVASGNSLKEMIKIFEDRYEGRMKFAVAAFVNGMSEKNEKLFRDKDIPVHCLIKTDQRDYEKMIERVAKNGNYHKCKTDKPKLDADQISIPVHMDVRKLVEAKDYADACGRFWDGIRRIVMPPSGQDILVLGTQEFMYPAIYIGAELEKLGNRVRTQSTTRNPLMVSRDADYPLHDRYELRSFYDSERITYLYDIGSYDWVCILTDAPHGSRNGLSTIINALRKWNKKIMLFRWV